MLGNHLSNNLQNPKYLGGIADESWSRTAGVQCLFYAMTNFVMLHTHLAMNMDMTCTFNCAIISFG